MGHAWVEGRVEGSARLLPEAKSCDGGTGSARDYPTQTSYLLCAKSCVGQFGYHLPRGLNSFVCFL